ncbi:hypothetical protein METHB2_30079 [Candidatus Methylobacter favarea]|uniref:Uncharacterized protein n=1 Tax=Candidatus Methylobacter favarea TaxID=2707345 RepID=A0A8S0WPD6_9GAMM|nr:hypothetical protein [Candidatus Methylobacter favarea]CAA9890875.1 hypothetical protein METHB2_30079 [Candidatus Methylobacter favarea]
MAGPLAKAPPFRSLAAHIRYHEQRLDERRQVLRMHASTWAGKLRYTFRQPSSLLCGVAAGFIAGELTRRPTNSAKNASPPRVKRPTALEQVMKVITLAQTVSAGWPWLAPSPASTEPDAAVKVNSDAGGYAPID